MWGPIADWHCNVSLHRRRGKYQRMDPEPERNALGDGPPRCNRRKLGRKTRRTRGPSARGGRQPVRGVSHATNGVASACAIQLALLAETWPVDPPLRVRMALHTGEAGVRTGDYYGPAVNHRARLRAVAHGAQVLISSVTADLVREALGAGLSLRDLGEHQLRDMQQPERVWQLVYPSSQIEFPPLGSLGVRHHNLPAQLSTFVGRERELDELRSLLPTVALVSMTEPGGVGKESPGTDSSGRGGRRI